MSTEQLEIRCGPADRNGKRVVIASLGNSSHRDRFDTDGEFQRRKFRETIIDKFNLSDDAHSWLEQRIIAVADAEDARADSESFAATKPVLLNMADVEPRSIDWLWPERIALGRLTLLVGRPGCGKSFLTCDMASRISTGSPWPDGSSCPQGSVILIGAEDDPADTVRPRLDAHHADASRVEMLRMVERTDDEGRESEAMFSLADVEALKQALEENKDCRLVVVDPIGSFLGGRVDSHRDSEVRSVLAPIANLAEQYGAAVLLVAHTRKGTSSHADDTALGSRAFVGIVRSVWHLCADAEDKQRRLLLPGKSNIAAEQSGLAFTIGGEPAKVCWEHDPVAMTADDALAQQADAGEHSALEEAVRWLRAELHGGPKSGKDVKKNAREDGIAYRTLDRARAKLGVVTGPDGFGGPWVWRLPDEDDPSTVRQDSAEYANVESVAQCGDSVAHSAEMTTDAPF